MFWTIIQYLFIAIVFVVAIVYMVKMVKDSLGAGKSCSKGCGCSGSNPEMKKPEKH